MRRHLIPVLLLLAAAACGSDQTAAAPERAPAEAPAPDPGPLHLLTVNGLAAVDPDTGAVAYESPTAVASPDETVVAQSTTAGDRTRVALLDASGAEQDAIEVEGPMEVRVVGDDGRVVLVPDDGMRPVYAQPTVATSIVVADPAAGTQRRYEVEGSVQPEALSPDGNSLYVLSYFPPRNPVEYQVNRLDLASGELSGVYDRDGGPRQDRMAAYATSQVWSPDGSALYTLYTSTEADPTSWVHVLDVEDGWAHCLDVPEALGTTGATAMTVSPDGDRLWAVDTSGRAVLVDTRALAVLATGSFEAEPEYGISAATDGDRLFVGSDEEVTVLDGATLAEQDVWETAREIVALRLRPGDDRLAVVSAGHLTTYDPGATRPVGTELALAGVTAIDTWDVAYQCAC